MHYEVLLVDDEPMVTKSLKRLFKGEFSAIHEAQSGAQALALMDQHPIDLVISDFRMPEMNGAELVSEIHKRYPQILKVILSGQTDMDGFAHALNQGAIARFLCKPWDNHQLKEIIRETIREHEQRQIYDKVTSLPTHTLFSEQIKQFGHNQISGACVALVNISHFADINREYGSQVGNQILRQTAERIMAAFPNNLIARVVSDHFAILLHEEAFVFDDAHALARVVSTPIIFDALEIKMGCTIGITPLKDWQENIQVNLQHNLRQLHALASNQYPIIFCESNIQDAWYKNAKFLRELRQSIQENALHLDYQPQMDARTLKIVGCEALLRWNHPERGVLSPTQFIPLIERYGMTHELTQMILNQVLTLMATELTQFADLRVSINLFASQLNDPKLSKLILEKLKLFQIAPERLEIEITETNLITNFSAAREQLTKLKRAGVRIAIDDFGTGYATYECLCELPVDVIKIDGCFVKDIPHRKESVVSLNAMLATAKALNLEVVAECVETHQQVIELTNAGCNTLQGYWFSEPLDRDSFLIFAALYSRSTEDNLL